MAPRGPNKGGDPKSSAETPAAVQGGSSSAVCASQAASHGSATLPLHGGNPSTTSSYSQQPTAAAAVAQPEYDAEGNYIYRQYIHSQQGLEDQLVTQSRGKTFSFGDSRQSHTGRLGYGEQGLPIALKTNYLKISGIAGSDSQIYQYTVTWPNMPNNATPSKMLKRLAMSSIISLPLFQTGIAVATDFDSIIVTNAKFDEARLTNANGQHTVHLGAPPPGRGDPRDIPVGRVVDFSIQFVRQMSLTALLTMLTSNDINASFDDAKVLIQAINIIINHRPKNSLNNYDTGGNKFFPRLTSAHAQHANLTGGLDALRGYYSSVRPATGALLLNVNVAAAAFYKGGLTIPAIQTEYQTDNPGATAEQQRFFLKGLRIVVHYSYTLNGQPQHVHRERVLKELPNQTAAQLQFTYLNRHDAADPLNGQTLNIAQYYLRKYGLAIAGDSRVCDVGSGNRNEYIPIHFCTTVSGQQFQQFLSGPATRLMIRFAARRPAENALSLVGTPGQTGNAEALRMLQLISPNGVVPRAGVVPAGQNDPQLNSVCRFGFRVATELLTVPGRMLDWPTVQYRDNESRPTSEGSWNLVNRTDTNRTDTNRTDIHKLKHCPTFPSWTVLAVEFHGQQYNAANLQNAIRSLSSAMNACGLGPVPQPARQSVQIPFITQHTKTGIEKILLKALNDAPGRIIFVVLPTADRWLYATLKRQADCVLGKHTICSLGNEDKFLKPRQGRPFFANIALKFNIKNGGNNHIVKDLWPSGYGPGGASIMLVGMDVTHPSAGSAPDCPSIGAIVASVDHDLTQWPGSLSRRAPEEITREDKKGEKKEEKNVKYEREKVMTQGLADMLRARLQLWKARNNQTLPKHIIVFRDGVSEDQYSDVLEYELPGLHEGCRAEYDTRPLPHISIIVVGKRHHTRFYPTKGENIDATHNGNPYPGTIVDRGIANRSLCEYWLQAHAGLQGSARPAHYVVIKDETGFTTDQMQDFTHKLCYQFNRATKAISICPPAYYADLLADRGRLYYNKMMNEGGAVQTNVLGPGGNNMVHPHLAESTWYV